MPTIAELIKALPEETLRENEAPGRAGALAASALMPVPVGRWRRAGLLGTLQAKIAAAYLFYWIRGFFVAAEEKERLRAETHWRTALRLLDSMGYLRGAVMKAGQTLANFPDIAPKEFVETLERLQYDAPPMHWALLGEMVTNELGAEPGAVFARFDTRPFAAASLGQVHAAQLRSGEHVAVKIQYPGIARAIAEDLRNLNLLLLPGRLNKSWENLKEQMEDLRMRLERETDYRLEAATLAKARALFRDEDGIVVPKVYAEFSTGRVLAMERLEGVHLAGFLRGEPSQDVRDEAGRKILRAWYRLFAAGRLFYADLHPGNFLFMKGGKLGLLDFGFMLPLDDGPWELFRRMDRALTTGRPEHRMETVREINLITGDPADAARAQLSDQLAEWAWRPRYCGGEFDFGNEAEFRRGFLLATEINRKRYTQGVRWSPVVARQIFGLRSMLYRLKARVDVRAICEEEMPATGWDRSAYA